MARTRCPKTGRFNRFLLSDDGTMDTVVVCSQCSTEARFLYQPEPELDATEDAPSDEDAYDAWVSECLTEAAEDHESDTEGY